MNIAKEECNTLDGNARRRARADSHGTPTHSSVSGSLENSFRDRDFEKKLFSLISSQTKLMTSVKTRHRMMEMMKNYSDRLGMTDDIKKLKVVHVAGTKGKGSTCAFVESILRRHGLKTWPIYVSTFNRCYRALQNKWCSCKARYVV